MPCWERRRGSSYQESVRSLKCEPRNNNVPSFCQNRLKHREMSYEEVYLNFEIWLLKIKTDKFFLFLTYPKLYFYFYQRPRLTCFCFFNRINAMLLFCPLDSLLIKLLLSASYQQRTTTTICLWMAHFSFCYVPPFWVLDKKIDPILLTVRAVRRRDGQSSPTAQA